jgi:hypothetical protein
MSLGENPSFCAARVDRRVCAPGPPADPRQSVPAPTQSIYDGSSAASPVAPSGPDEGDINAQDPQIVGSGCCDHCRIARRVR